MPRDRFVVIGFVDPSTEQGAFISISNPVIDDFYPADLNNPDDPYGYYRVEALPGATHMDGAHALQHVRSRRHMRGDFARSQLTANLGLDSTCAPVWLAG